MPAPVRTKTRSDEEMEIFDIEFQLSAPSFSQSAAATGDCQYKRKWDTGGRPYPCWIWILVQARTAAIALLARLRGLVGNDQARNLGVGCGGYDVPGLELRLVRIGAAGDDLLGIDVANAGQGFELSRTSGIDVDQVAGRRCCCRFGRLSRCRRGDAEQRNGEGQN